jgi:predicted O-linked N-acetylglucosamine transferase (SPINDLY family)
MKKRQSNNRKAGARSRVHPNLRLNAVSVSDVLRHAARSVLADGAEVALTWLKQQFASGRVTGVSIDDAIVAVAQAISKTHPRAVLELLEPLLSSQTPTSVALLVSGVAYDKLGNRSAARDSMKRVVEHSSASPDQVLQAANLLVRFGEQELALKAARAAYDKMGRPIEHAATLLYIAQATAEWSLVEQLTAQMRQGYADGHLEQINESPRTHLLWCDEETLNHKVLQHWSRRNLPDPFRPAPKVEPLVGRRLRIGYLSSDFREHPTARLILGVLRHHNRAQVELFMYCSGWDDGSQLRKDLEKQFENIQSVAGLSDEAAAALIRSHRIDVLVELNGPTRANRMGILRHRPAPVQIDYLGWPGSVGGRLVDYIVGDYATIPEGAETLYPEKVIRLHPTYQANDHAQFKRAPKPSRKEVGLPEDPALQVLGMFNAVNKVHQQVWDTWMQILKDVPNTILWMLDPGPVARKSIAREAQKAGVPVSRILASPKLPQAVHLARIQCCDLMLDPWPYGGHTSTADALFSGVPVLAMEGNNFASRVCPGLLRAAGLDSMICRTPVAYAHRAVQLLRNPAKLRAMRQRLLEHGQTSPVFDTASRTRQLEKAFRAAVERALKSEPLLDINMSEITARTSGAQVPETISTINVPVQRSLVPRVFPKIQSNKTIPKKVSIDIFVPDHSNGLMVDAQIIARALGEENVQIITVPSGWYANPNAASLRNWAFQPGVGIALFIERMFSADFLNQYQRKVLLPNPEWLTERDVAHADVIVDEIWHKSRYSMSILPQILPSKKHIFLGFTSSEVLLGEKDFESFAHFAGKSRTRHTQDILDIWLTDPELLPLRVQAYGNGLSINRWINIGNIDFYFGFLNEIELQTEFSRNGIHLCTSQMEGFGHYINEARSSGCVILTLNAPPMNELIDEECGVLIPCTKSFKHNSSHGWLAKPEDIKAAIHYTRDLPLMRKLEMGDTARQRFLVERDEFLSRLLAVVRSDLVIKRDQDIANASVLNTGVQI